MERILFNDEWFFSEGTATSQSFLYNETAGGEKIAPPRAVTLPHDAMIELERKDFFAGACTGFYVPKNIYYTKTFELSPEDKGKVIWLEFDGVYQFGFVYVNDQLAGKCINGYTEYYIDISRYVHFDQPNQLKVVIRNGVESSRWYSGAGIYRNVYLLKGNPLHVRCEGARVSTEILEKGHALLDILTPVVYQGVENKLVRVLNEVVDQEGNVVAYDNVPFTIWQLQSKNVHQKINIKNPIQWNLQQPYLYCLRTTIMDGDQVLDQSESHFGIRKLELDVEHGLRLNGETVKLKGGCLHHDHGVIGTTSFMDAEWRRLNKLKNAGFNAVRTGAHPFNKEVLDICDRIGMLVYDEMFDAWTVSKVAFDTAFSFEDNWEQDLTSLVLRDFNHPSVIMIGIGNEIQELGTTDGQEWARKLAEKVHEIDKNRIITLSTNPMMCMLEYHGDVLASLFQDPEEVDGLTESEREEEKNTASVKELQEQGSCEINSAMNALEDWMDLLWKHPLSSQVTEEACAQVDLVGLNYATGLYEIDHSRYPNRVMFGSETYPRYLGRNWEIVERCPYVIGDFCWTAWDYLGEAGIGEIVHTKEPKPQTSFYGNWPWRTAAVGVFDLIGDEMPIGYWRELVWNHRKAPYIAVRPPQYYGKPTHPGSWNWISDAVSNWNWKGYENQPIEVEVYTKAESVELFVNGKSAGVKRTGEIFQSVALFDTIYEPGEVKAVASDGEVYVLRSAVDESVIKAHTDFNIA